MRAFPQPNHNPMPRLKSSLTTLPCPADAFPHLDVPAVSLSRAADIFRASEDFAVAALANAGLLLFLWMVEPLLPDPGFVLHAAGFLAGRADGPLPGQNPKGSSVGKVITAAL